VRRLTACLGPRPQGSARCPTGALVPATGAARCDACCRAAAAELAQPRPRDHADRAEGDALLRAWRAAHGSICPGCPPSGWEPHAVNEQANPLTVDHNPSLALAGLPSPGSATVAYPGKRVMCRAGNSSLGAHL
jgi:hypothetical protein